MLYGGSLQATALAQAVKARDPAVLSSLPAYVPLDSIDALREIAYLAIELQHYSSAEDLTLRLCRWLRHHTVGGEL